MLNCMTINRQGFLFSAVAAAASPLARPACAAGAGADGTPRPLDLNAAHKGSVEIDRRHDVERQRVERQRLVGRVGSGRPRARLRAS